MNIRTQHILAVAVAVILVIAAVPIATHARSVRMRNECLNRLRQLYAPMDCCVPMEKKLSVGDALDPRDIAQYLKSGKIPKCPCGPDYIVVWKVGGPPPKCPVHGNLLGESGGHQH